MQRPIWRLSAALAVALGIVAACGGGTKPPPDEPELLLAATPRQINDRGQASQIDVIANNADGAPGTGSVTLRAIAGEFGNGTTEETLNLTNGKATTSFTCIKATDAKCSGNVRIDGTWDSATGSTTVVVSSGTTTMDGGMDGGTDGGQFGVFTITLETAKPALVTSTSDSTLLTATVTRTATGTPVPGVQVVFSTTQGSFTPSSGTTTTQAPTDAAGKAQVSLYAANAAAGKTRLDVSYDDAAATREISFVTVSALVYVTGSAKSLLGLESSGRETTTPVSFKVINPSQQAVPDVELSFEVSGAGGATVTQTAVSNSSGVATTTLRSGNSVGVAIVKATVSATKSQLPSVSASHPGTPVVGGKPSESGLAVNCALKNLNISSFNPPLPAVTTECTAKLSDHFTNVVGLATPVLWFSEAGAIQSSESKPQQGTTPNVDTGVAKTLFDVRGAYPPYPSLPLPGEPYLGSATEPADHNPRDMAVTVIAVVAGEEAYVDGSGSGPTAGQQNGRWDPGEWFTDLPEPFVDRNDNGVWDSGEVFFDTEQIDCANPNAPPHKNDRWDPPNGCWDSNTNIWRVVHLVYTGNVEPNIVTQALPANGVLVPLSQNVDVPFYLADAFLNRLAPSTTVFTLTKTGSRGQASLRAGIPQTSIYGGFSVTYREVEGTTQADGGIALGPTCDTGKPTPPNSSTSPVATRCVRVSEFSFPNFNSGVARLTGETTAQPELPDGGMAPPVPDTINVKAGTAQVTFDAQYQ